MLSFTADLHLDVIELCNVLPERSLLVVPFLSSESPLLVEERLICSIGSMQARPLNGGEVHIAALKCRLPWIR